jgi:hypothetical protein
MEISILLIEENEDHQVVMFTHLTRAGFSDVKIVRSPNDGLEACRQRPRHVVIVDSGVVGDARIAPPERERKAKRCQWDKETIANDKVDAAIGFIHVSGYHGSPERPHDDAEHVANPKVRDVVVGKSAPGTGVRLPGPEN